MLYLLAAPSNFFKMLNFFQSNNEFQIWDQMSYLGISKLEFEKTIVIFKIKMSQNAKLPAKQKKIFKFGTKHALCGYFWDTILQSYCHIWNQHPRFMRNGKCRAKQENFKYRTNFFIKMQTFGQKKYFWIWDWLLSLWLITIITFEISTLELFKMKKICAKEKRSNLEPKYLNWVFFGM